VTDFGDWAFVISGLRPHWLWRTLLLLLGAVAYYAAVRIIGIGMVRYLGVSRNQSRRLRMLTMVPYFSAILLSSVAALLNPIGIQLLWESALPATAGGQSGLLWLQYHIPRATVPKRTSGNLVRSYQWILVALGLAVADLIILGRGITIHR